MRKIKLHRLLPNLAILLLLVSMIQSDNFAQKSVQLEEQVTTATDVQSKQQKIDSLLQLYAQYGQFNGTALIAEQGQPLYSRGFGLANKEWQMNNKTDTKFRLASVTKQFTALLVMQLVAKGQIDLDSTIIDYLPDYPSKQGDEITIHHLLCHTSGLPNYTSFPTYRKRMQQQTSTDELLHFFADSSLLFTPGERFSYSNSGYAVLGLIIEKLTGSNYEEVLQSQILEPLQMKNTGYDHPYTVLENRAAGYDKNGASYRNASYIDMSVAFAAGGMYSTVEDLFLWDQALYTEQLLPQKYLDLIFTKYVSAWGEDYGYGWFVGQHRIGNTSQRVATIHHDGVINGFGSLILRVPATQSSIILLSNVGGTSLYQIAEQILGILHDQPYDFPKKSLAQTLTGIIKQDGLAKAKVQYLPLKESASHYLDEREMNLAGYDFLQTDQLDEAAYIFNQNLLAFPHSSNVYDSYGELLLKLGDTSEAIIHYKKSMLYNPKNENGRAILKKLGLAESEIDGLTLELLVSDAPWKHEIFHFPLNFAPSIDFEGREDARFPPGWRQVDNDEFWSYVFAWHINQPSAWSSEEAASNLQKYFDGLMQVVNKHPNKKLPKTVVHFNNPERANDLSKMSGQLTTYDAFVTEAPLELFVRLEQHFCDEQKKSIIRFQFSPKPFDHSIWSQLNEIKLRDGLCTE